MKNKIYILTILLLGISHISFSQVDIVTEDFSLTELGYQSDVSNSDLLAGITPTTSGPAWSSNVIQLTDGIHGGTFATSGIQGAWTTVNATATYDLGTGTNGTGYDLTSIVSIAAWESAGFGNQGWTIEVQPVGGAYTTLYTVAYNPIAAQGAPNGFGATKVVLEDSSGKVATGIEKIRITANAVTSTSGARFVWRELDIFGVDTPDNCESSLTQLTFQGDVSNSDLLAGITPSASGWNNTNSASVSQLTDGVHGGAGLPVEGAWTTTVATATYDLGLGPNGTGYDLNSIVSIADWNSAGFGNQNWTIEVQPVGGSFTTLLSGNCQSLGTSDAGTTKVIEGDGSTILASGIQKIRISANSVNGGNNGGAFIWRELDVFGVATPPNCDFSLIPLTYQGDVNNSDLLTGIIPTNITGWNTDDGASVSQLTDGVHGDDFTAAGGNVEGAFTTVGATVTYAIGLGANGLGYDLNSIVSIADWFESGYGDQNWTIEVQPVGGSYTTLHTGDCQPLTGAGTTKVVVGDGSAILASGIQKIRITANAVNGGGFVWRELDVFGVATPAVTCVLNIMPMGDSITAGYTDNPTWANHPFMFGYRADLYTLLVDSGIDVQYMGSSAEPWNNAFGDPTNGGTYTPPFDLRDISQDNHHGYGGKTVSYINPRIATWLAAEEPDIILLKIGTNSQDTGGLNTLVNNITTNYPDIYVIVAQIMPKINYQAGIVNYNNYIKNTMVPAYQGLGKNVTTVDLYTPFLIDPSDLTSIDPSLFSNAINHPDADGYNLMAQAWQIAINDLGLTGCTDPCLNGDTTEFIGGSWNNGTPDSSMKAIIKSNYTTTTNGNLEACSVTIDNGVTVTIEAGDYFKVTSNIINNGTLTIEHEGSLVQVDDNSKATNNGTIEVKKSIIGYDDPTDFSIIGSPMTAETRDGVFNANLVTMNHITGNFVPHPDIATEDPGTENFADEDGDNWDFNTTNIASGVGYLVGGPSGGGDYTSTHTQGTLNNGIISSTAIYNGTQIGSPNMLSNPYASAIDLHEFISANTTIVDEVYFWEHITIPGSTIDYPGHRVNNYEMGDISMRNDGGGLAAPNAGVGASIPSQFMASGQGFAIKAKTGGTVTFNNSMRVTGPNTGYRNNESIERLYLNIINPTYQLHSSTLIAFTENATNGFESNFDAERLATPVSLYSVLEEMELAIQGRSEFNENHIIPIGFRTQVEESQIYNISLGSIEGDNLSQATIYLKDNLLNTTTNLSEENYTFTSNESNQKDRFEIVFTEEFLGNQDINALPIGIYPNPTNGILNITSPQSVMTEVTIYNIAGREVRSIAIEDQNDYKIDISRLETSMYFVKIQTQNGSITKQIIKQ